MGGSGNFPETALSVTSVVVKTFSGNGYAVKAIRFTHSIMWLFHDDVVRCDIGEDVPLADSEIDVAVFSLSLMGENSGDYLREAARTLLFDGRLIICEAVSRLPEDAEVRSRLARWGFHTDSEFNDKQRAFLAFILAHYVSEGVEELEQKKLTPLLKLKYHDSLPDALADLGRPEEIGRVFAGFQKYLYQGGA